MIQTDHGCSSLDHQCLRLARSSLTSLVSSWKSSSQLMFSAGLVHGPDVECQISCDSLCPNLLSRTIRSLKKQSHSIFRWLSVHCSIQSSKFGNVCHGSSPSCRKRMNFLRTWAVYNVMKKLWKQFRGKEKSQKYCS